MGFGRDDRLDDRIRTPHSLRDVAMTPELSSADLLRVMRSTWLSYPLADGTLGVTEKCGL